MPGTRKLGRTSDHRKAMLRAMVTYLLENGKIETTVTRAKEVRAMAEKMITTAKTNDLHSKRQVLAYVTKESVPEELSVIGHNNYRISEFVTPPLTTVNIPLFELGHRGGEILMNKIANPSTPIQNVLLDSQLLIRDTVRNI